jgi:hypothetical protein
VISSITEHPNGLAQSGSPAAEAQSITGRPYMSWTQVSSYQQCPRAFAFRYVEHADPDFVPSSLLGSAMHEAFRNRMGKTISRSKESPRFLGGT